MKYLLIFILFFAKNECFSQKITAQVVDVSGGTHKANGYTMTYSIGQTAIEMLKSGNYIITQGFQQANPLSTIATKEEVINNFEATVFPNPTQDVLHLNIEGNTEQNFQVFIYNLAGQKMLSNNFFGKNYEIEVSQLPVGEYIIQLQSSESQNNMTSKFIKF